MPDKVKGWSFAIVGSDANNVTKFIYFTDSYDDALKSKKGAPQVGWRNVRIYDANLQFVKGKPGE